MHIGIPAHRRAASASLASGGTRRFIYSLPSRGWFQWQAWNIRGLSIPALPPVARRSEGSSRVACDLVCSADGPNLWGGPGDGEGAPTIRFGFHVPRSEEHTSELQSQSNLVCRLLLEIN